MRLPPRQSAVAILLALGFILGIVAVIINLALGLSRSDLIVTAVILILLLLLALRMQQEVAGANPGLTTEESRRRIWVAASVAIGILLAFFMPVVLPRLFGIGTDVAEGVGIGIAAIVCLSLVFVVVFTTRVREH